MPNLKTRGATGLAGPWPGPGKPQSRRTASRYSSEVVVPAPTTRIPPVLRNGNSTGPNTTTPALAAHSWQTGDRVLVIGITEDAGVSLNTPVTASVTGTGLTFAALGTPQATGSSCWLHAWTATAAGNGSGNISTTRNGGSGSFATLTSVWYNSDGFLRTGVTSTPQTLSVTRTQDRSAVQFAMGDWSATNGAGTVPSTANWTPPGSTEVMRALISGIATWYSAYWPDEGSAGVQTYGTNVTVGSGVQLSKIAVEILGTTAPVVPDEGWGMDIL